ncbi:MAG: hypothetical protein ACOX0C_00355 [Patescibacteria group bacterium]|jgi:hypothetical protein
MYITNHNQYIPECPRCLPTPVSHDYDSLLLTGQLNILAIILLFFGLVLFLIQKRVILKKLFRRRQRALRIISLSCWLVIILAIFYLLNFRYQTLNILESSNDLLFVIKFWPLSFIPL